MTDLYPNDRKTPIGTLSRLCLLAGGVRGFAVPDAGRNLFFSNDVPEADDFRDFHQIILAQAPTAVDVFPVGGSIDSLSV